MLLARYTGANYIVALSNNRVGVKHIANVHTVNDIYDVVEKNVIAEMAANDVDDDIPIDEAIEIVEDTERAENIGEWEYIPNEQLSTMFDEYLYGGLLTDDTTKPHNNTSTSTDITEIRRP
jgi:hypothetical protein